jgi:hypothetical protein
MILNQHGIAGLQKGSNIPDEYKRVEYVYNTGRGTIMIVPNNPNYVMLNQIGTDHRIEIGMKIVSITDDWGRGFYAAYGNNTIFTQLYLSSNYNYSSAMSFLVQNGTDSIQQTGIMQTDDCECVIDKDKFILNGTEYSLNYTYAQNYLNIYLFDSSFKYKGFKYIKAYSPSNELVIDLEPVVRKADSVPGYYDTVTQQFVTAYNTGLVAGPDVT